jgi:hypothetical protein
MNPNRGETQPQFEQAPLQPGFEQTPPGAEVAAAPEAAPGKRPPQVTAVPTDTPQPLPPAAPVTATSQSDDQPAVATAVDPDTPAADTDRIEKQWVHKAKAIVEQTQDDPYKQKSEMSKVKAEYIKKRYNKIIRADETGAA